MGAYESMGWGERLELEQAWGATVQSATAFESYAQLVGAMANGYVPTLNGGGRVERLALALRAQGYRVYRNGKVG